MKEKLIAGYLRRKLAGQEALERFLQEEKGASDMVVVLVLIVIIVAVAGVFRTQLMGAVTTVFEKLTDFIG